MSGHDPPPCPDTSSEAVLTEADLAAILDPTIEVGSRVTPSEGVYAGARGTVVQLLPGDRAVVEFKSAMGDAVTANYPLGRLRAL